MANAFSADWQYSDELESFVIAHNNDAGRTTLTFLGIDLVAPIDCETPTPTPTEDPPDEPTEEPSESLTPTQEPTEKPSPSPTDDDDLPDTGAGSTGVLVMLGAALVAGAALLYRYRRGTVA